MTRLIYALEIDTKHSLSYMSWMEEPSLIKPILLIVCSLSLLHLDAQQPSPPSDQMDLAEAWATIAAYDIRVFPNPETHPLDPPGLVYYRVDNLDLKVNVFTPGPETIVRPTLVFYHGGGWAHYTKDNMLFSALPYLAQGMAVVEVDYRQANQARAPAAVEDCRCALHWVFKHAAEYGFDVNRLVVGGVSAGGHLALMTGMLDQSAGFDDGCAFSIDQRPVKVAAIVDFFGPTDVAEFLYQPHEKAWAIEWMAGVADREELAKRVSPMTYVRPGLPPIIMVHGTADPEVPYEQSVRLHQALDKAGTPNELVSIPNGQHGIYPDAEKLRAQNEVFQFLRKYGVLSPSGPPRGAN